MPLSISPANLLESLENALSEYTGNAPAVLLQVTGHGLSAARAIGQHEANSSVPANIDHAFNIGSQTKMMVASVLLQLVDEGRVELDTRLSEVIDVTPWLGIENVEQATLGQLLTHRSGIVNYSSSLLTENGTPKVVAMLAENPGAPVTGNMILALTAQAELPADFAPGEGVAYSNTAYHLLGKAIEGITGSSLSAQLHARIFQPLGMHATSLPGLVEKNGVWYRDVPPHSLHSYAPFNGEVHDVTTLPLEASATGGVVSTTSDMARFMKALVIDATLVPESQHLALADYLTVFASGEDQPFLGHSGESLGVTSHSYVHSETGLIFSLASTISKDFDGLQRVFAKVVQEVMEDPAWRAFDGSGPVELEMSAAAFEVVEGIGIDGAEQTVLRADGVSVTFDGGPDTLNSARLSFSDGSVLRIADRLGGRLDLRNDDHADFNANNHLAGQSGHDDLRGGRGDDKITGGEGQDRLAGRFGQDSLFGGEGNDHLRGGHGNDHLEGGTGDDKLVAGKGNDTLIGGAGNDTLIGGEGIDVFVFAENGSGDQIFGFEGGKDLIDLSALGLSFEDLTITERWWGFLKTVSFEGGEISIIGCSNPLNAEDFLL